MCPDSMKWHDICTLFVLFILVHAKYTFMYILGHVWHYALEYLSLNAAALKTTFDIL